MKFLKNIFDRARSHPYLFTGYSYRFDSVRSRYVPHQGHWECARRVAFRARHGVWS